MTSAEDGRMTVEVDRFIVDNEKKTTRVVFPAASDFRVLHKLSRHIPNQVFISPSTFRLRNTCRRYGDYITVYDIKS